MSQFQIQNSSGFKHATVALHTPTFLIIRLSGTRGNEEPQSAELNADIVNFMFINFMFTWQASFQVVIKTQGEASSRLTPSKSLFGSLCGLQTARILLRSQARPNWAHEKPSQCQRAKTKHTDQQPSISPGPGRVQSVVQESVKQD